MTVSAWEDEIELKTYMLGPGDPNPPLHRTGSRRIYPYPMLDDLTHVPQTLAYRALHLENEYLHLMVLPELGGRLYSLYDKVAQREVFYRNNVVKYGFVARRAAWISGGIEFNFPHPGHTHVTVSPVMSGILEDPDGQGASIIVGATDRVSRMRWSVELGLLPGEARLTQRVVLHNPTALRQRSYFWANSAVPATDDLHLVFPATQVRTSHGIHGYPMLDGTDLSYYRNHQRPNDIFCMDPDEDFFGCYFEDQDAGLVHWADRRIEFGKKFFTWGTADEGMIWVDLLTDDDGQYVELQAGRFVDQSVVEFMAPYQEVEWTEIWYPVSGIGGFQFANDLAATNCELDGDRAIITGLVNVDMGGGRLLMECAGKRIFSEQVTLAPDRPFAVTAPIPGKPSHHDLSVVLLFDGDEILRFTPGVTRNLSRPVDIKPEPLAETSEATAEELATQGVREELSDDYEKAAEVYGKALQQDAGLSSAHLGLGLINLRAGLVEKSVEHLERAVARDRQNDEAWYYLALARSQHQQTEEAETILWWLAGRSKCAAEANLALAKLALHRGDYEEVLRLAEDSSSNLDASFIVAVVCRLLELDVETVLEAATVTNPLAAEFLAERIFTGHQRGDAESMVEPLAQLAGILGDDPEEWLELALKYRDYGLLMEAAMLLRTGAAASEAVAASPMVHYHLADLPTPAEVHEQMPLASAPDPEYCFPSRLEDLEVLEAAVARNPGDWQARTYLGNVLASLRRREEAFGAWHAAANISDKNPVLCRNLGLAYSLWGEEHDAAIEWYDKAIARRPDDYHLYIERDEVLERAGADAQSRLAALEAGPEGVVNRWDMAARRIACLLDLQRWDEPLDLLQAYTFLPWEGARGMHAQWTRALVGRAEQRRSAGQIAEAAADYELALTYPRNLGVGRAAYPEEARLHWLLAGAAGEMGDEPKRQQHLQAAAEETHARLCEADVFRARALMALGREKDADDLATQLRQWAEGIVERDAEDEVATRVLQLLGDASLD